MTRLKEGVTRTPKKKADSVLTIAQKRVAVLKDAIQQLKQEKLVALSGFGFVGFEGIRGHRDTTRTWESLNEAAEVLVPGAKKEVQAVLGKFITDQKPCTVCAKGAMTICAIRKYDNFSFSDAANAGGLDEAAEDFSRKFFGERNADLMEAYFEGNNPYDYDRQRKKYEKFLEWHEKYHDDTDKLIAIFKNAIKNGGIFVPEF